MTQFWPWYSLNFVTRAASHSYISWLWRKFICYIKYSPQQNITLRTNPPFTTRILKTFLKGNTIKVSICTATETLHWGPEMQFAKMTLLKLLLAHSLIFLLYIKFFSLPSVRNWKPNREKTDNLTEQELPWNHFWLKSSSVGSRKGHPLSQTKYVCWAKQTDYKPLQTDKIQLHRFIN